MIRFKENIDNTSLSVPLHDIVRKVFKNIEKSPHLEVIYDRGKYGDFVLITLENDVSICIDLSVSEHCVDLFIGQSKSPCYLMTEIVHNDDLMEFENLLTTLLHSDIKETLYKSGRIVITELKTKSIIFKVSPILSFLGSNRIDKELVYKSWVQGS